jgi:ergothioneine biosynthesis protein EgtB
MKSAWQKDCAEHIMRAYPSHMTTRLPTTQTAVLPQSDARQFGVGRYDAVRNLTEKLCQPLVVEDYVVQSMPDVSPTKWHLAHTSWFFETFLLKPHAKAYVEFDPHFGYLFNSYYNTIGDRHCRQNRGQLSRPTVAEVYAYRKHVDQHMRSLLAGADDRLRETLAPLLEIGLHHEQQHQELMITDIKHVFWVNPMRPAYVPRPLRQVETVPPATWIAFDAGLRDIGHDGNGFAFDNECPRHPEYVAAFHLASRLVTNGEYKQFINEGGYTKPEFWLSAGWAMAKAEQWHAPLYWLKQDAKDDEPWWNHTLAGLRPVSDDEPVCHVSYYEADAFARWADARLPAEAEWEFASTTLDPADGAFVESDVFHPTVAGQHAGLQQMFGNLWQWTSSAYLGYPGYRPPPGALGEYNGKFMCNQFVLRGGSVATSRTHIRRTYRNFFPPDARWQFSGFRLARDA